MTKATKDELQRDLDSALNLNACHLQEIERLKKLLAFPNPHYITVEMAERSFLVAKKIIGSKGYIKIATTQSRAQTEAIVNLLNKGEESK